MPARNFFASGGIGALLVLFLCIFQVTATDVDHGHQRHPRQFGGRGGGGRMAAGGRPGGGAGGRPAGAYGGPWNQRTWYSTLSKRFDEVPIDDDRGIHTEEFLDASQSLPSFFDLLGQIAFRPARIDNEQNLQKIRDRFNGNRDNAGTLQRLVQNEKDSGVGYQGSASEALLWLSRTLEFTAKSLRKDLEDNRDSSPDDSNPRKPLSDAFKHTYPETLKRFHNDFQQALFSSSWGLVPSRQTFYRRLAADDSSEAAVEDTEKWVSALERIVDILKDFINKDESRW